MSKLKLVVITGLPGSGKSTLAEGIAKKTSLPIFSVDPIESSIIKSGIKQSFETGLAAYLVAETLTAEHFKLGQSVVIDAVSPVKESRDMWHHLANEYDAKLIIIECVLDESVHKKRIESRIRNLPGIPEVTWEEVLKRKKEYLPWEEERLIIDTANENESNIKKATEYIKSKS